METRPLAGHYALTTTNLEAIARHYVGQPVRVRFMISDWANGWVRRVRGLGVIIELNKNMPAENLGHVLFHEIAHLILHADTILESDPDFAIEYSIDEDLAGMVKAVDELFPELTNELEAYIALRSRREGEANLLATELLETFEAAQGPFLEAIV